jgi:hypothetical protein
MAACGGNTCTNASYSARQVQYKDANGDGGGNGPCSCPYLACAAFVILEIWSRNGNHMNSDCCAVFEHILTAANIASSEN